MVRFAQLKLMEPEFALSLAMLGKRAGLKLVSGIVLLKADY